MVRSTLRFTSSVLIVSGALMVLDAATTVVWQEPVSAFLSGRQQARLKDAFASPPQRVLARRPLPGDAIARIALPSLHRDYYVVEGTATGDLRRGPGHYADTRLPGERGTVAIAGHRTTFGAPFRNIDQLRKGDPIRLETPYGTFNYRVEQTRIVSPGETSVKDGVGYDRLVLTACHPLYSAAERIVAFARLVSSDESSRDSSKRISATTSASDTASTATQ